MRLPYVLDQLNDAVFLIDPRTDRVSDANSKACEMLGYSPDELTSMDVSAIHPDEIQEFKTFTRSVQSEGRGWTDELSCLTKSGEVLAAEISASMIVIDGESCMVAVVRPVFESRLYTRHVKVQRDLATVEERTRLSREIHDTIAQALTVLVLRLDLIEETIVNDPASAHAEFESLKLMANRCVEEVRRSVWDLQPLALDASGLVAAVRVEMDKLGECSIKQSLEVSGAETVDMDRQHQLAALRVIQEALSNVIKHSDAKTVLVRLDFGLESLAITVTDDGIGFETGTTLGISPAGGGFGMSSMRERARLTGGSVEVQSSIGTGVTVEARIPYRSTAPGLSAGN